jgi:thiamine biosynthesis protein ThiS
MKLQVNGRPIELGEGRVSVLDYLVRNGLRPELVAVELNLDVLERGRFGEVYLAEGDVLEIVKFVGGGARLAR